MQIKALRGMKGDYGSVRRNGVVDVPDYRAQQLIKRGVAVPVKAEGANPASSRPSQAEIPTGGPGGKTKSLSSSRRGRPRQKSNSKKGEE